MERTLVILKPDAVQRGLVGPIITRLEQRGLRFAAMKLMQITLSWPPAIMRSRRQALLRGPGPVHHQRRGRGPP